MTPQDAERLAIEKAEIEALRAQLGTDKKESDWAFWFRHWELWIEKQRLKFIIASRRALNALGIIPYLFIFGGMFWYIGSVLRVGYFELLGILTIAFGVLRLISSPIGKEAKKR